MSIKQSVIQERGCALSCPDLLQLGRLDGDVEHINHTAAVISFLSF